MKKTYHIITIGCQMNKADSERIAGLLEEQGFKPAQSQSVAGLIVLNTCGVRQSAEDRVYGLAPKIKSINPKAKIILTGCLVNRIDVQKRLKNYVDIWLPISQISNFQFLPQKRDPAKAVAIFNKCQMSNVPPPLKLRRAGKCQINYLSITPKYQSNNTAYVPLGNGCNNFCSYCVVPYARGREVYRPAEEILAEVKDLINKGYKEIILIAQNVNSYQSKSVSINAKNKAWDLNRLKQMNFADLLKMINNIPGNFRIRFATSHPKDMSDKLIETMAKCEKVAPLIHLPIQSGDNEILRKMNRNYTATQYKNLIKKIRSTFKKYRPGIKVEISTDIIAGFPGETKKQFQNTVRLAKTVKFDKAYIARYSPRPGTAAARLKDDVSVKEKKRRWLILERLINKI